MQFRDLLTTGHNLDAEKLIDELRGEVLKEVPDMRNVHKMLEELFGERINTGLMRVFSNRFNNLTHDKKVRLIDEIEQRYKQHGEYGFATIVLQPLSRF